MIVRKGSKWEVRDSSGEKLLGTHNSKQEAAKQLAAIEISKREQINEYGKNINNFMNHEDYQEILEHLLERIDLLEKKLANKDYDEDGKIETGSEEYLGSRSNAIKKAIANKKKKQKIQEALDRVGGNIVTHSPGIRCLSQFVNKESPLVENTVVNLNLKKNNYTGAMHDSGSKIQLSESVVFGGFPTIKKKAN